jgi:hypothetical protein
MMDNGVGACPLTDCGPAASSSRTEATTAKASGRTAADFMVDGVMVGG